MSPKAVTRRTETSGRAPRRAPSLLDAGLPRHLQVGHDEADRRVVHRPREGRVGVAELLHAAAVRRQRQGHRLPASRVVVDDEDERLPRRRRAHRSPPIARSRSSSDQTGTPSARAFWSFDPGSPPATTAAVFFGNASAHFASGPLDRGRRFFAGPTRQSSRQDERPPGQRSAGGERPLRLVHTDAGLREFSEGVWFAGRSSIPARNGPSRGRLRRLPSAPPPSPPGARPSSRSAGRGASPSSPPTPDPRPEEEARASPASFDLSTSARTFAADFSPHRSSAARSSARRA